MYNVACQHEGLTKNTMDHTWHFRTHKFIPEKPAEYRKLPSWKYHIWPITFCVCNFLWSFIYVKWWTRCDIFVNEVSCIKILTILPVFWEWIYIYENVTYGPSHKRVPDLLCINQNLISWQEEYRLVWILLRTCFVHWEETNMDIILCGQQWKTLQYGGTVLAWKLHIMMVQACCTLAKRLLQGDVYSMLLT